MKSSLSMIKDRSQRIEEELKLLKKEGLDCFSLKYKNCDLQKWEGLIIGPKRTILEGFFLPFEVTFPKGYPNECPKVTVKKNIFHPNIKDGYICMSLFSSYNSEITMRDIFVGLLALLTSPNPSSPLNREAADLFNSNKSLYQASVVASLK
jgi:ubiquitin-conjugating enzyme E2 C